MPDSIWGMLGDGRRFGGIDEYLEWKHTSEVML
jgi:hypothetical protein